MNSSAAINNVAKQLPKLGSLFMIVMICTMTCVAKDNSNNNNNPQGLLVLEKES
jgi:hypothetical protein